VEASGEIRDLISSWRRHLEWDRGKSPRTIKTYMEGAGQLADFLEAQGLPTTVADITREHIEAFIDRLVERWKPGDRG
jgi:site-specific recombinase XerD